MRSTSALATIDGAEWLNKYNIGKQKIVERTICYSSAPQATLTVDL